MPGLSCAKNQRSLRCEQVRLSTQLPIRTTRLWWRRGAPEVLLVCFIFTQCQALLSEPCSCDPEALLLGDTPALYLAAGDPEREE